MPPSIICMPNDVNRSSMDSQKPTTYMAHATALANEKISPIEPPNSGPRDLEIMKYVPPPTMNSNLIKHELKINLAAFSPLMIPFVLMALIDKAVIVVTTVVVEMRIKAW